MNRWVAIATFVVAVVTSCLPQQAEPTPTPAARPTTERPRFELATYMYALQTKGRIRIGVLESTPPFSARDASGRYTGFAPDLGREVARAIFGPRPDIDTAIEWVPVTPATSVESLTAARTDLVIAGLPAGEQHTAVDLTAPFILTGERILIRASNDEIKELPDLETKTVCVQLGSGVDEHVIAANAFARTLELDTYASCLAALQQGQVDAIGADESILWDLRTRDQSTKIVGRYLVTVRYAIGLKRSASGDRQGFLPFVNEWLADAVRDGTWARVYARHIGPLSGEQRNAPTQ